ncbi:hypothetical protein J437_LFUL012863 [Ladona fulva]|uniref:Hemolymph juvenile hormone binding protein n=1 Tax=Ladona fulva TaxID=123851 RepID=A0A8K0KDQ0_LADFU|nr:hypothetical protein J437_LFUL012863 [Ladona fulva]
MILITFDDILEKFDKKFDVHDKESLDKYLFELIEGLKGQMKNGIPKLNIPPIEPMKISSIVIDEGGGMTKLRAAFENLQVYGLSNYTTVYAKSDPKNYRFTLGIKYGQLKIVGDYDISGRLLLVPIKGSGKFWSILNGINADSYNVLQIANNELSLVKTQTDFDVGRMRVRLDNLFGGDPILGETINGFLNEQSPEIIRELKPQFSEEIDKLILSVFGKALSKLPVEKWMKAFVDKEDNTATV